MDSPSPLGSNSLPYVFTKFQGQGVVTNQEAQPGGAAAVIDPTRLAGSFRGVLPSDRQAVAFPPIPGDQPR
jgi:hypothetical protein